MPCTTKIFIMPRGDSPSVRKMAMSDCFSFTAITSDDTKLNAATTMIQVSSRVSMRFSISTALK